MATPRSTTRNDFDDKTRLRLLEQDADDAEAHGLALQEQVANDVRGIRTEMREEVGGIREEVNGMKKYLIGLLVSVATACILLAINVVVVAGGGG